MFGSKFSLNECLKLNVHWSSSAMSWMHNSAAAAASRLGLNGGAEGLRGVAYFDLLHDNSRSYKCCMALSRTVFRIRTLAARTTPSCPTISFSRYQVASSFGFVLLTSISPHLLTEDSLNFHSSGGVVLVVLVNIQRPNGAKSHLYSFEGISLVS